MADVELEVIDLSTGQSVGEFSLTICEAKAYELDTGSYRFRATYLVTGEAQESDRSIVEGENLPLDFTFTPSPPTEPPPTEPYSFKMKCANVGLNVFHPNALNYQPSAWAILKDLGVNTIRIGGGVEGDLHHINIPRYPTEWAQNLYTFLSEASAHGIKVFFLYLGSKWGTGLGIVSPSPEEGVAGTPIADAKTMIDQLAGNNALGHNFITDPRLIGWSVSNEVNIGNPTVLNWNIQILDYIRSKGGKAWLACPYLPDWQVQTSVTEPLLRGHVDFLEVHFYGDSIAANAQNAGKDVYTAVYNWAKPILQDTINGRGTMPVENLILGEFGIWRGYATENVVATFTDETRRDYYRAMFDAARDVGLQNTSFHDCFVQKSDGAYQVPMWSVVDIDGTYFPLVADVIKAAYATPAPPIPLWKAVAIWLAILGGAGAALKYGGGVK